MNSILLMATIILFPFITTAQNLVPNPSFECGVDLCNAFQIENIAEFSKYACGWSVPTTGTSDIHSTKAISPHCFTYQPYFGSWFEGQHVGSQRPRSGERFAGIYTYSKLNSPDTTSYREYLQVKLSHSLIPGEKYCAEINVSRAENTRYASNNLGMSFNTLESKALTYAPLPLKPHLIEKTIIADTSKWVKIGGIFEADNPAQYLVIGNFFSDDQTDAVVGYLYSQNYNLAYYFIDDVSVEKLPYDKFTIAGRTVICDQDSTILSASAGVDNTYWTALDDTATVLSVGVSFKVSPQTTTSYRVFAKGCQKKVIDTITVFVNPLPKIDLGNDTTLCLGSTIVLDAGEGFESYQWQGKPGAQFYEVDSAGTYRVEAHTNNECKSTDEVNVAYIDIPLINLGEDILVCNEIGILSAGTGGEHYQWSTGSIEPEIEPTQPGQYWVNVQNQCGETVDTVNVYSVEDIFIPNVLTLNSDEQNEYFQLAVRDYSSGKFNTDVMLAPSLKIFDRWGTEVYSNQSYLNDWPSAKIDPLGGEYFYHITYSGCKTFKGWLQIIR